MGFLRDFGLPELLFIGLLLLIFFGRGKIGPIASEIGKSIRAFRDGLSGKGDEKKEDETQAGPPKEDK